MTSTWKKVENSLLQLKARILLFLHAGEIKITGKKIRQASAINLPTQFVLQETFRSRIRHWNHHNSQVRLCNLKANCYPGIIISWPKQTVSKRFYSLGTGSVEDHSASLVSDPKFLDSYILYKLYIYTIYILYKRGVLTL